MKIFQTARGYEALNSLPVVQGVPSNPPPDDGSGEYFAVWDAVGKQVLVYDKGSATWSAVGGSTGALLATNNLSDLTDKAAARTNLGVSAPTAWKDAVEVATTANGTLASAYVAGQTVDGIVLVLGWRILLKNQTTGSENGIYIVTAGAPTRATDMATSAQFPGAAVVVQQGTANADTAWICTNTTPPTVGTTAITFAAFGGSPTVHVTGSMTGDGSVGSPLDVRASSASVPGTMSASDFAKLLATLRPREGTALIDNDQTVQPGTDAVSQYVQPAAAPLTLARAKTIGVTSAVTGQLVRFIRKDTGAFNITLTNGGNNGGNLTTTLGPATVNYYTAFTAFYNGVDWVAVGFEYLSPGT